MISASFSWEYSSQMSAHMVRFTVWPLNSTSAHVTLCQATIKMALGGRQREGGKEGKKRRGRRRVVLGETSGVPVYQYIWFV